MKNKLNFKSIGLFVCLSLNIFNFKKYKLEILKLASENDKNGNFKLNELAKEIEKFEVFLTNVITENEVNSHLEKEEKEKKIKIKKTLSLYSVDKKIKKLSKEILKIDRILRSYLNELENNLIENKTTYLDIDSIIRIVKRFDEIYHNSVFKRNEHSLLFNYIFYFHEQLVLRLFSSMVIHNKKQNLNLINKENLDFICEYNRNRFKDETIGHHKIDAHMYYIKRFFLNLLTREEYFYSDMLIELNKMDNFAIFNEKSEHINTITDFDFDLIFISGLNSEFSKTWRVPSQKISHSPQEYIQYLLYGKHREKIYAVPSYELWIPQMFENKTFKDYKVRYLVTNAETKLLQGNLCILNIPDYTIDQLAEKIAHSFKNANVGKKPFVIISHSMGGLITKKVLKNLENSNEFKRNLKGIVFFSTPHFGSNIVHNILDMAVEKYFHIINFIGTTASEYGLHEEDVKSTISNQKFTNATREICFMSRNEFIREHEYFKNLGYKYICINETDKTYIKPVGHIHIVDPESCILPETENYFLKDKLHSDVQKFSPNNFEETGYKILVNFIKQSLSIENKI